MSLKIAVFYSFESEILQEFQKNIYLKIFCGKKDGVSQEFIDKMDYFDDDFEGNLSHLNKYINEMTGIYWLYKNYHKIGNPDFVGTAHYRRFIDFSETDLQENNIICHEMKQPFNVFQTYSYYHNANDLRIFNRDFSHNNQEYAIDLNEFMNSSSHTIRNIFILSRENFMEYGRFIEKCIESCLRIKDSLEIEKRDKYQFRVLSFILERMTGFWIFQKSKNNPNVKVIQKYINEIDIKSPYQRS